MGIEKKKKKKKKSRPRQYIARLIHRVTELTPRYIFLISKGEVNQKQILTDCSTFDGWCCLSIIYIYLHQLKGTSGLCVRFKKNVDGQGTQAIIKNLNLKKLKRFWNQNVIKVNDYTV